MFIRVNTCLKHLLELYKASFYVSRGANYFYIIYSHCEIVLNLWRKNSVWPSRTQLISKDNVIIYIALNMI